MRSETQRKSLAERFRCTDCKKSTKKHPHDDYMLSKEIWQVVHPEGYYGSLCSLCLDQRLQKHDIELKKDDLRSCLCYVNRRVLEIGTDEAREEVRHIVRLQDDYIAELGCPILPKFVRHLK